MSSTTTSNAPPNKVDVEMADAGYKEWSHTLAMTGCPNVSGDPDMPVKELTKAEKDKAKKKAKKKAKYAVGAGAPTPATASVGYSLSATASAAFCVRACAAVPVQNQDSSSHMYVSSSEMIFAELRKHLETYGLDPTHINHIVSGLSDAGRYAGSRPWFILDGGCDWSMLGADIHKNSQEPDRYRSISLRTRENCLVMEIIHDPSHPNMEGYDMSLHLYPVTCPKHIVFEEWRVEAFLKDIGKSIVGGRVRSKFLESATFEWIKSHPPPDTLSPKQVTYPLQLAMMNLEKHKVATTKSIAKEAETKTTSERASVVLEKANRDYLQSCEEAELASKEMVEHIMTQETLQKEVDQLVRERRIQEIQDKIRIQNEVSLKQAEASAQRQSELEAELAVATLSD